MAENKSFYINVLLHSCMIFILSSIQNGLWYRMFNGFPSPFFMILFLTYIGLYRSTQEAFILGTAGYFICSSFTIIPHGTLFVISFLLLLFLQNFKNRIFWPGPTYYLAASLLTTFFSFAFYYILTWSFEETSFASVRWLYLFLQLLLTTLISPLFYFIYQILDRISGKEQSLPMEDIL